MLVMLVSLAVLFGSLLVSQADIGCDGIDDDLLTGLAIDQFITPAAGTVSLWYKPTGAATNNGGQACTEGGILWAAYVYPDGVWLGMTRHSDFGGLDRLTAFHWDGAPPADCTVTAYTANVWTHLAWVHGGGVLRLYKDGVEVETTVSGDTADLTAAVQLYFCAGTLEVLQAIVTAEGVVSGIETFASALSPLAIRTKAQARLHRFGSTGRSGAWALDECTTTGDAVSFFDQSGNARHLTGDNGPTNTGLTCLGNTVLTYPWGPE